jgi:hypothetical protein
MLDKGPVPDSENFRERRALPIMQLNIEVMLCQLGSPIYGKSFTASPGVLITEKPSPGKTQNSVCANSLTVVLLFGSADHP